VFGLTSLLVGQLFAIVSVTNATFCKLMNNENDLKTPLLLTATYYLILFLVWIIVNRKLTIPKFSSLIMIILNTQANFFNVWGLSFLDLNIAFIIMVSNVFWTFLFTNIFLKKYLYKVTHLIGAIISLIGACLALYFTISTTNHFIKDTNYIFGIILCSISSLFQAISFIIQESTFCSNKDIYEFFPWLGLIGFGISCLEAFCFGEFSKILYLTPNNLWYDFGFSISFVMITSLTPFLIKRFSASLLSIALISQIGWSYINELIFFGYHYEGCSYLIGFAIILIGIIIFHISPITLMKEVNNDGKHIISMKNDPEQNLKLFSRKLLDQE
jgi:drug/metabolite transporter (DMT)-like permease